MKSNLKVDTVDKIDLEELIKEFKVMSLDTFYVYLKEVWKDLAQRSDEKAKGINKLTFSKYYELPGIISDRLFAVLDTNKNEYVDLAEFAEGMKVLFSESYDALIKFIFDFYDFDKDGKISREDVRVVLSYVPLNKKVVGSNKLKFEKEDFKDRVESQDELHEILDRSFKNAEYLDKKNFSEVVENKASEIFLFILIFLYENRPFSNETIREFEGHKKSPNLMIPQGGKTPVVASSKLIVSPNMNSKFRPSQVISKSPVMQKRASVHLGLPGMNNAGNDKQNYLSKLLGKPAGGETKVIEIKSTNPSKDETSEGGINKVPVSRKIRQGLQELDKTPLTSNKKYDAKDIPLTSAFKSFGVNEKSNSTMIKNDDSDDEDSNSKIKHEGHLYKITATKKLKKLWFKLIFKDLYYFKNKDDTTHKGMHNLSGVYVIEEKPIMYEDIHLYSFSVVYPKKSRVYYVDNEAEYLQWVKVLRRTIGYANLNDLYEVKEKLGNGKFGLVRLGIHKQTGRKVAVKIMNKKDMTAQDLELVRTEIEILKVAQQPHIIRLYDIFENVDYIYIIMEHCSGGDLFSYIEERNFRLPEPRASQIIHKLATAIYYLHQYGITHRDLKPENILMTDSTDEADIRLLDFGLSKIIGPNETCTEPYGTLSYVAPEVLMEKPYNKSVDLWSIGIITYLLLCGSLPFDDETSEREIARQTIHDPVPYPSSIWKKLTAEAKAFVDNLLQKDPSKRMSIKEVLEHPWIKKFNQKAHEMRRESKDLGNQFKIYTMSEDVLGSLNKK